MESWNWIRKKTSNALNAFEKTLANPGEKQSEILRSIISENKDTVFGKKHHFSQIESYEDFVNQVPICTYDGFQDAIEKIARGEHNILTCSPVIQFEETGGSTAGAKLIPYTKETLCAFQHAVLPWLGNLLSARPGIARGRFFLLSALLLEQIMKHLAAFLSGQEMICYISAKSWPLI